MILFAAQSQAAEIEDPIFSFFQMDQNEIRLGGAKPLYVWDAQGWLGTDEDKAFFKSEGEIELDGKVEAAEVQLLYSRMISAFFDAQAGIRYDLDPDPSRGYAVVGIQGLAPQFFEIDTALFLSQKGDLTARFEAEYELLLTQRLVLQPSIKFEMAAQDVRELSLAAGLTSMEVGLRMRYEIRREFAPYIGVSYERKLFETASLSQSVGANVDALTFVAGLRLFF